ncbi:MAG: CRISPR system precrRNA processing endoribonuclease RAMP protein Cas6 [Thermodesulfobacteriota bacterium]
MFNSLSHFTLSQFKFTLKVIESLSLPEYKGAVLRGGFGYAFRKVVCITKSKDCSSCLLKEKCVYSYVFETPPSSDSRLMRKYPSAPHPFVLTPPLEDDRIYEPGEIIDFELILIGKSIDYLPYFIYTFDELGKIGLGKSRGKFFLERVEIINKNTKGKVIYSGKEKVLHAYDKNFDFSSISSLPPTPCSIGLIFLTPTRLKYKGDLTSELEFHVFFRNLLRRISLLSYFHCGAELNINFCELITEAEKVQTTKKNLRWYDWERYSTRQQAKMKLGGFIGEACFLGNFEPFWPYLALGEFIHVGKGSSFGLGKYEILRSKDEN